MLTRRLFLGAALAAPAIVRSESLMKLWVPPARPLWVGVDFSGREPGRVWRAEGPNGVVFSTDPQCLVISHGFNDLREWPDSLVMDADYTRAQAEITKALRAHTDWLIFGPNSKL